jgi:hypothetical protein
MWARGKKSVYKPPKQIIDDIPEAVKEPMKTRKVYNPPVKPIVNDIPEPVRETKNIKYEKSRLKDSIDVYLAQRDQKLTGLGQMNVEKLLNMIPKWKMNLNEIHHHYNNLIDNEIERNQTHIQHEKQWLNENPNMSDKGKASINEKISDYENKINKLKKSKI